MKHSIASAFWFLILTCTGVIGGCTNGSSSPTHPSATHFSVTAPTTVTAGTAFSFTVTVLDASNVAVTSYAGTIHFTSTDVQAIVPVDSVLTNGTANFSATLKTSGSQTLTATDTVTTAITGTSSTISVSPATTHFSITAPTTAVVGMAFPFTVTALDASNVAVTSYAGTIHFTSTDVQAVVPVDSVLTNGTANFLATLQTIGNQTITATDTIAASVTGISNVIVVFSHCLSKGAECPPMFAPCCPGLACIPASTRAFCEPVSQLAPADSRFTSVCNMLTARESHTATLLGNGLVLIIGGDDRTKSLSAAELFNPISRSFAPTADMAEARARHTSTLLNDGTVLVIGGRDASGNALASAESYDPARMSFVPTSKMSNRRESHAATTLSDGRVLVVGGDNTITSLDSAEVFDPASSSFTPTGKMTSSRAFQTATLLKNGKVLVTGGRDGNGNTLASAELYDPTNGLFTQTGRMSSPRKSHTAILLSDGKVLVIGGNNGTVTLATAELFDPVTGSFALTGSMQLGREFHTATLRNDGTVLVAGGANFRPAVNSGAGMGFLPESTATVEVFNPLSRSFTPTSSMVEARSRQTATLLSDGTVVLTGGVDEQIQTAGATIGKILSIAELFQ